MKHPVSLSVLDACCIMAGLTACPRDTQPSGINSVAGAADKLIAAAGGSAPADPVALTVELDLADTGGDGWADLLATINTTEKYTALDLSASTMAGTEFDPNAVSGAGYIVSLVLPGGAASIKGGTFDDPAFKNFTGLTSLSGGNVETIGDYAFRGCTSLVSVSLPAATSVDLFAFAGCTSLASVSLPVVTSIGDFAFADCTSLASLSLPAVTSIGDRVFGSCTSLASLSLPAAASIADEAFRDCTSLTSVSLPAAASIGDQAFSGCTSLASVSLPASLTNIGNNPFRGCTGLTNITVNGANPSYKHSEDHRMLLDKAGTALIAYPVAAGTVTLPGISSIGGVAFSDCTSLVSVSLPAATDIGDYAFVGCTSLASVSLPAATGIGDYAFSGCTYLASVSLPVAASIGREAFSGCTSLALVSLGSTAPTLNLFIFSNINTPITVTVTVPSGATGYGTVPTTYSSDTSDSWGNTFRAKGWDGTSYFGGTVNTNITLKIEAQP